MLSGAAPQLSGVARSQSRACPLFTFEQLWHLLVEPRRLPSGAPQLYCMQQLYCLDGAASQTKLSSSCSFAHLVVDGLVLVDLAAKAAPQEATHVLALEPRTIRASVAGVEELVEVVREFRSGTRETREEQEDGKWSTIRHYEYLNVLL